MEPRLNTWREGSSKAALPYPAAVSYLPGYTVHGAENYRQMQMSDLGLLQYVYGKSERELPSSWMRTFTLPYLYQYLYIDATETDPLHQVIS